MPFRVPISLFIPLTSLFSKLHRSFLSIRSSPLFHQNAPACFPEGLFLFGHFLSCDWPCFLFYFPSLHQLAATFFKNHLLRSPGRILLTFYWMTHVLNKLPEPSSALFSLAIERRIRPFKMSARYTDVIRFPDPQFSLFRLKRSALSIRSPLEGSISIPTQLVRLFCKRFSVCQKKRSVLSSGSFSP